MQEVCVPQNNKGKLVVAACCRECGQALSQHKGSIYGRCCSNIRRQKAMAELGVGPITPADFDGPYLKRRGR
jgi:hypothetical protein